MIQKHWKNLAKQLCSLFSLFLLFATADAFTYDGKKNYLASETPYHLKGTQIKENLGEEIDLSLSFKGESGKVQPLKDYFKGNPALMTVVYYKCPSLCNFHLNGLFEGVKDMGVKSGKDYSFIVLSMDERESPALAIEKKKSYLKKFGERKVHFLTGKKESIKALTDQLGFSFRWDEETLQFAHSPVAYVLSPEGKISRYLYGVQFDPKTLRLSLAEAAKGKIRSVVDRVLLFCYRFDPKQNRYTLYAYNVMRAGAGLMVTLLLVFLVPFWFKHKRQRV